jgi:hypothetical protein
MTVFDDGSGPALYTAGYFGVFKWNGQAWSSLGTGLDNSAYALAVFDDGTGPALYVGGSFNNAGGSPANHVARWNGHAWSAVGAGFSGDYYPINALCVYDDGTGPRLYAGGGEYLPSGSTSLFAKWSGTAWVPLGGNLNGAVYALAVFNDGGAQALYVGGQFTTIGTGAANNIARWNGSQWTTLSGGLNGTVDSFAPFDDGGGPALAVGGTFTTTGSNIVKWRQNGWSPLGTGVPWTVRALTVFDDGTGPTLYVAGAWADASHTIYLGKLSKWNDGAWTAAAPDGDDIMIALAVYDYGGSGLYAGGAFSHLGTVASRCVARWGCQPCGSADFNCDGDVGTDADIEAFFRCLAGTCPSLPCMSNADFNFDSDVGTDADIEAFFRVLGGGSC